jgi:hypothetical protein
MHTAEGSLIALDLGTSTGIATTTIVPGAPSSLKLETVELATQADLRRYKKSGPKEVMRNCDPRARTLCVTLVNKIKNLPGPIWIAFEDVRFAKSLAQAQLWASLRGVLWALPVDLGRYFSVNTASLKKFAGAKGTSKAAMEAAFRKRFGYTGATLDDNLVDAAWVLTWVLETKFGQELKGALGG